MLGLIRPDSWNVPLFLHVLGAMVLVGATATAVTAELVSVSSEDPVRLRRLAFRTLLLVALPAYILMHGAAEWIHSKEFPKGVSDPTWVGIGYIAADAGGLVFLVSLILAGVASRKSKPRLGRAAGLLAALALAGWIVAVWAMGAKPS
jgi:hypothetical protein